MDQITLKGLEFYGYHGVLPEEKKLGQKFIVNITLGVNLKPAGESDDLSKTVNYAEVYQGIKEILEGKSFDLIETVAERISLFTIDKFILVHWVEVEVRKPQAPIVGIFDFASVSIKRERS
jgi:FolB domain-containing protein